MNERIERFLEKFDSAKNLLRTSSISEITSIKFRSNTNQDEYRELVSEYLHMEPRLKVSPAPGNFWGNGWLIEDSTNNRAIIVEHETGLEILYIFGSVASLISIVPIIISGWKKIQRIRLKTAGRFEDEEIVEIRRFTKNNELVENIEMGFQSYLLFECLQEISNLNVRVHSLEEAFDRIKYENQVHTPAIPKKKK